MLCHSVGATSSTQDWDVIGLSFNNQKGRFMPTLQHDLERTTAKSFLEF